MILCIGRELRAQNMPHEIGFWGAHQGQWRLEPESDANRGFFQNPDIAHVYYSFVSSGVQSLAVFIERVAETRSRNADWTYVLFGNHASSYPAHIEEHLALTTLGLETSRTLLRTGDFRVMGTLSLGYGLGGADARVTKLWTDSTDEYSSAFTWQAFELSLAVRARYSILITGKLDLGVIAGIRYWGYPSLGPLGTSLNYNGPDFRNSNNVGYIAGIAIGF